MGRYSMGIGLGLFCWPYSREQSSVTPAVTLDKTITELTGAASVWCQYKENKHSHGVYAHVSILKQLILDFRNKTNVTVKKANDTILTHSLTQYYYFQYLNVMKNKTSVKLQLL